MTIILAMIANAFGRRFAGGLLGQWLGNIGGTQVARLAQAVIAGGAVAALAPAAWWGLVAIPAVWAGATLGFGRQGMIPRGLGDVIDLSLVHGLPSVAPVGAVLAALHLWHGGWALEPLWAFLAVAVAGLARGPAYWLATLWQPCAPVLGLNRDGIPDPPPLAEFYSGALLGLGLALAV